MNNPLHTLAQGQMPLKLLSRWCYYVLSSGAVTLANASETTHTLPKFPNPHSTHTRRQAGCAHPSPKPAMDINLYANQDRYTASSSCRHCQAVGQPRTHRQPEAPLPSICRPWNPRKTCCESHWTVQLGSELFYSAGQVLQAGPVNEHQVLHMWNFLLGQENPNNRQPAGCRLAEYGCIIGFPPFLLAQNV